jgi:hypothetical protein
VKVVSDARFDGSIPALVYGLGDGLGWQEPGNAGRCDVVKENEHPRGNWQQERGLGQGCGRQIQAPR